MAHRDHDDHTGRNLALVGGTALLFWLLLRGKGWGLGGGGGGGPGGAGSGGLGGAGGGTNVTSNEAPARCQVFIRGDHIDLDGTPADLPTVVARCRASGRADVKATGDTIVRTIGDVVHALQAACVSVYAPDDVWRSTWATP